MWFTKISHIERDRQIVVAAFCIALALAIALSISGLSGGIERQLRDSRDTLRIAPVTGEIVIVEIDGRSLQELDQWPWPRGLYADAITELDRLGARQIAFDIEFSARSIEAEDKRFAEALSAISQPVILPTFRQRNLAGDTLRISESLPLPELREHAFLASVNVQASEDGQIKHYAGGMTTNGTPRPSLANMMAGAGGAIDASFRIDQSINPLTVPRVSFVDLVEGRVSKDNIAGKSVVFGNTAIELGDRYPTALFGVQPGVAIHVQAAETIMQGRVRSDANAPVVLGVLAMLLGGALAVHLRRRQSAANVGPGRIAAALGIGLAVLALALDQASLVYIPLTGSLLLIGAFMASQRALLLLANLEVERLTDTASGLPNARSMQVKLSTHKSSPAIIAARIADYSEVSSMLTGEGRAQLDCAVARRLALATGIDLQVYRLDSGVFGWLARDPSDDGADELFNAARALFNAPVEAGNERLRVVLHFGMAADTISQAVDASEYARRRGLIWSANAQAMLEETQYRQRLLGELDEALENGAISVAFQPKLAFANNAITGGECLVRWNSPTLGRISPADFIPILEEKERIADLTLFVLREAMARQREAGASGHALNLAVNVSAQLLGDQAFVATALEELRGLGALERGGITLEITESAPLQDSETARDALTKLRDAGARISIDDYGTGQATLNYLQDFPAQEIKLDQSFIRDLAEDRKDQIMVQSTIELGHALGFQIVAEGIETGDILEILRTMGCDYAQGWHVGKPMEWDDFARFLFDYTGEGELPPSPQVSAAA